MLAITQSGETTDTLAAMREAQRKGARALGIVNVVGSHHRARIGRRRLHPRRARDRRRVDQGVHLPGHGAGAADARARAAARACRARPASSWRASWTRIPEQDRAASWRAATRCSAIAEQYAHHNNFLYLGRGDNFPVALEGALKLKEISYIHAEGYPAAEMKHGPIALIDENMPVVFICTAGQRVREGGEQHEGGARAQRPHHRDRDRGRHRGRDAWPTTCIYVPQTLPMLQPLLSVIPLQLLAYHIAVLRGCDVDQPRNLAKSVTVE